jgi:hypothetical protein
MLFQTRADRHGGLMAAGVAAAMVTSGPPVGAAPGVNDVHPIVASPEQIIQGKASALGADFTGPAVGSGTVETVPGGYRIRYQNCDIYYSETTSVHEVHGGIRL